MTNSKILIVDDEPYNLDYLEQELEGFNYDTMTAANGQEALEKIQKEPPDLILLDIMMPVMDGFTVLGALKSNPATRDLPVIVISANNDMKSVVKGIAMGAEDYLPKPFEPALLFARISSSLIKKQMRDLEQLYLKSLEREFEIARDIQQSFLPSELPEAAGWKFSAYFKAAREVAGDFYDAFVLPDGNLAFLVGDVCGKGVGAALFMTLFRSLLRATCTASLTAGEGSLQSLTPAERLQHAVSFTNRYISETHAEANMFATALIGVIDITENVIAYVNCGNEPALVIRDGEVIQTLKPTGPVMGILPDAVFGVDALRLEDGDVLLAFTDGLTDAKNEHDAFFGTERLSESLKNRAVDPSMLVKHITTALIQFSGNAEQFDDITLLAVQKQF